MLRGYLLLTARRVRSIYRQVMRYRRLRHAPTNTTSFGAGAKPGPLITDVFEHIRHMPGWFNVDDCAHFSLVLSMQSAAGVRGDIFEIGSYYGRSTCLLASQLRPGERLVVCDSFEAPTDHAYPNPPSPDHLWANLRRVNPGLSSECVQIIAGYSSDIKLDPTERFRFAHVDGGHSKDVALTDLRSCADHLMVGGVIVVDDYQHRDLPGVTAAVDQFLGEQPLFSVLADLNRHGAVGRKIYLVRMPSPS